MCIFAKESDGNIEVTSGRSRLEAQLQVSGEATVRLINGKVITVVKNSQGKLVEKLRILH